jgi:hypothetical protein
VTRRSNLLQDVSSRVRGLFESLQNTAENWKNEIVSLARRPGARGYLLQSSRDVDGLTQFYVNDNGHEGTASLFFCFF